MIGLPFTSMIDDGEPTPLPNHFAIKYLVVI